MNFNTRIFIIGKILTEKGNSKNHKRKEESVWHDTKFYRCFYEMAKKPRHGYR